MKLYYYPISTYSQKALLGIYEKQIEVEKQKVNIMQPDIRAMYEEVYPIGKIPMLVLEDGQQLPETSCILDYLDTTFDQGSQLIPSDPAAARQVRLFERMHDFYVNDATVNLLFQGMKPQQEQNVELIARSQKYLDYSYEEMNAWLADHSWFGGQHFSLADCAAIPPLFYGQQVYAFHDYPHIVRYFEQAKERASYQKVLEEAVPVLKEHNMA